MIIQKVEIQNFRLFYRDNVFNFTSGLNLIIGSCGDGKSTFVDALEWLFRTDGTNKMDTKFISKKRCTELMPNDSDNVRVAMSYEHKGKQKVLIKHFRFTKSFDGEVSTSNYMFSLIENSGTEQIVNDGVYFDKDLPSEMRKFMMYKGEGDLHNLQSSNSLRLLVDSFSGVKDFDKYASFMEYVMKNADMARDNALRIDKRNTDRIKQQNYIIEQESNLINDIEHEIKIKQDEAISFEGLLRNIELGSEPSRLLVAVNRRIDSLSQKRAEVRSRLREDYTQNLLEKMWVLVGIDDTIKEFSAKVNNLYLNSRNIERVHHFVEELQRQDTILRHYIPDISAIRNKIDEAIALNNRLHDDIKKIDSNLDNEFEQKKRILTQTDGLSEEQLLASYVNISDWMDKKNRAENRIDVLKRQREQHRGILEEAELALSKMSEGTNAAKYTKIAHIIKQIAVAFKKAEDEQKRQIIYQLEDKANMFLQDLYGNDFTGTIKILEMQNGRCESFLTDGDGTRIFNPGSTLKLAYLTSLLLAIGKMMCENKENEMPLIYDGSVSRFDTFTGNSLLDSSKRQMIVLTRDYLMFDRDFNKVVDIEKIKKLSCTVYRIEKKCPFDSRRLGTMQTVVKRLQ